MSLFMGEEAPSSRGGSKESRPSPAPTPRPLRRALSARELGGSQRSFMTDSASITDLVFNGNSDFRPASRDCRRRTNLSPSMTNGTNMREALTQAPAAGLRSPRVSSVRRHRSPSEGGDCDSDAGSGVFGSIRSGCFGALGTSPKGSPSPRRHRDGCHSPGNHSDSVQSWMSPRNSSALSGASCLGGSVYNPRAKPGSVASEVSRSMSGRPESLASRSSCAEDHLWRELFHAEVEPRKVARLRDNEGSCSGKSIGNRGKTSKGIPWRQIPGYDNQGRFCESGDPLSDKKTIKKASGASEKRFTTYAGRLDNSYGVSELLAPVSENCENYPPPPPKLDSEAREAWLHVVKRRMELKHDRPPITRMRSTPTSISSRASGINGGGAESTNGSASNGGYPGEGDMEAMRHWQWRQLRKGNEAMTQSTDDIKDHCPWHRTDSAGDGAKSLQSISDRKHYTNPSRLNGTAVSVDGERKDPREALIRAEPVAESRRDWRFSQVSAGKWDGDESYVSFDHSNGGYAPSNNDSVGDSRRFLSKSASSRSFSSSTVASSTHQVHSIYDRTGSSRPRWK